MPQIMQQILLQRNWRLKLEDLVLGTAERIVEATAPSLFSSNGAGTIEEVRARIARYEAATEVFVVIAAIGCSHSVGTEQDRLWSRALARIAEVPDVESGLLMFIAMRRYPALLCFYSAGLAATSAESWATLRELFLGREVRTSQDNASVPLIAALYPHRVLDNLDLDAALHPDRTGGPKLKRPVSDHLSKMLREPLRAAVPSDTTYVELFDRFEFLLGATLADLNANYKGQGYIPSWYLGSFSWRYGMGRRGDPAEWALTELKLKGQAWALLQAGLFGGDLARAETAFTAIVGIRRRSNGAGMARQQTVVLG